jgi:ABC-type glycerol-3-phosphate transport system permease component
VRTARGTASLRLPASRQHVGITISTGQTITIPVMLAKCEIGFAPVLEVFLAFQRHFVAGAGQSGIKG